VLHGLYKYTDSYRVPKAVCYNVVSYRVHKAVCYNVVSYRVHKAVCYNVVLRSKNLKINIYRIIILPLDWYGYETWSLTLREDVG
jgi:hypothetical protein